MSHAGNKPRPWPLSTPNHRVYLLWTQGRTRLARFNSDWQSLTVIPAGPGKSLKERRMSRSEVEAIETELSPPSTVARPECLSLPLVFNSPHSGRVYPKAFLAASRLDSRALRRSEDAYVEELFGFVTALGAALLHAHFPRAYLDVNREPYELDLLLFRAGLPHDATT